MDYILSGDKTNLLKLAKILDECAQKQNVRLGTIKSTLILVNVIDEAQKAGLVRPKKVRPGNG